MNIFTTPDALFCFKIGGAVLAGFGACIKVFKEIVKKRKEKLGNVQTVDPNYPDNLVAPRDLEEPHSLFWETIELTFIIGGLVINLTATAIDQKQTVARNESVNAQTAKQLQDAEESLNYLERLATHFDTLSFSLTYKITTNNVSFALLNEYLSYHFSNNFNSQLVAMKTNSATQFRPINLFEKFFSSKKDNDQPVGVYSENIIGYLDRGVATNHYRFNFSSLSQGANVSFKLSKEDLQTVLSSFTTNSTSNALSDFLFEPEIYLKLVAAKSPVADKGRVDLPSMMARALNINSNRLGWEIGEKRKILAKDMLFELFLSANFGASEKGDLFVFATNSNRIVSFLFIPASKELFVRLSFDCPKSGWEQTKWMSSLPDLSHASLFLGMTNTLQESVVPVCGRFAFDRTWVTITNFYSINSPNWRRCKLPDKREILDTR